MSSLFLEPGASGADPAALGVEVGGGPGAGVGAGAGGVPSPRILASGSGLESRPWDGASSGAGPSSRMSELDEESQEKVEHYKILIKELSRELQSAQIRRDGMDTLSQCLKDQRQEMTRLESRVQRQEKEAQVLQRRLMRHGLPATPEEAPDEAFTPGLPQTVLDNVLAENRDLKAQLKYLGVDPSRLEEALVELRNLNEQLQSHKAANFELQRERESLLEQLGGSPEVKSQEISRMRQWIEELEERGKQKDLLCHSLGEQVTSLQNKLREATEMCSLYNMRLKEKEMELARTSPQGGTSNQWGKVTSPPVAESPAHLKQANIVLRSRVESLTGQLAEVVKVNGEWQKHNKEKTEEFRRLQERNRALEDRVSRAPTTHISEAQQEQIDKLILQYKHQVELVEEEKQKIEDENRKLRTELDAEQTRARHRDNEITTLRVQLESLTESERGQQGRRPEDDREHIQMLQAQVQVFKEDFESERKDRERSQRKVVELESDLVSKSEELDFTRQQLTRLQTQEMSRIQQRRVGAINVYQCDSVATPQPVEPGLISRSVYQTDDVGNDEDEDQGEDVIDFPERPSRLPASPRDIPSASQSPATVAMSVASSRRGGRSPPQGAAISPTSRVDSLDPALIRDIPTPQPVNSLQCPTCQQEFSVMRHADFVEHMDKCCSKPDLERR